MAFRGMDSCTPTTSACPANAQSASSGRSLDVLRIGDGDESQMDRCLGQHCRGGVDGGGVRGADRKFPAPNVPACGSVDSCGPVNHGLPTFCGPHQCLFADSRVAGQPALAHRRDGLLEREPGRIKHSLFRQSSGPPRLGLDERKPVSHLSDGVPSNHLPIQRQLCVPRFLRG